MNTNLYLYIYIYTSCSIDNKPHSNCKYQPTEFASGASWARPQCDLRQCLQIVAGQSGKCAQPFALDRLWLGEY